MKISAAVGQEEVEERKGTVNVLGLHCLQRKWTNEDNDMSRVTCHLSPRDYRGQVLSHPRYSVNIKFYIQHILPAFSCSWP